MTAYLQSLALSEGLDAQEIQACLPERPACLAIGDVAFGAVQMRMQPRPFSVVLRLGKPMGAIPVAFALMPERL